MRIVGEQFEINGKETPIYSGAIHYFRSMPEQWEDLLKKLKLAGFNTVETYVCWNMHEPKPGEFCFDGMLDIAKFLQIAKDMELNVIFRPGPYICAEWDLGGLPAWLLADKNMRIRCMHQPYLDRVEIFYKRLFEEVSPFFSANGGNIIAVQIENEYGHYGSDKNYLNWVKDLVRKLGCEELVFTSDGNNEAAIAGGTLPDVYKTLNFGSKAKTAFAPLEKFQKNMPLFCMEFWCGWFDEYGVKHHTRDAQSVVAEVKDFLEMNASFNVYMFHGGTNFGFTPGANFDVKYKPTITSYDYCAILNEWGDYTPAYHAVREVMLEHQNLPKEELPPSPKRIHVGDVPLTQRTSIWNQMYKIGTKHEVPMPEPMECLGQNTGYIHYRTTICGDWGDTWVLLKELHDFAYVYRNGVFEKWVDTRKWNLAKRLMGSEGVKMKDLKDGDVLDIFVDAMGHVNFGEHMIDRKGLSAVRLFNMKSMEMRACMNFEVNCLPFDNIDQVDFDYEEESMKNMPQYPCFIKGEFETPEKGVCFVDTKGLTKGCIFVNGFNLGRYWKAGPQQTLYIPKEILKDKNEIIIFEQEKCEISSVNISDQMIWSK